MDISTVPGGTAGLILFGVVGFFAVVLVVVMIYARMYQKASPNEVLVISGRGSEPRLVIGSGQLVIPLFERVDRFSLETMTIELLTPEVYTAQGVPVIIDAVAQVKVRNEPDMVRLALERFLSKSPMEIKEIVKQTLEGHTRAIIGQMNVEGIITARDEFAQKVAEVSSRDLANMGLTIDSFSIKDVKDNQGYLAALGKPRTAEVKRDAAIAEANAARDAQKAAAGASQEAEVAKIEAKTRIAEKDRDFRIQQAEYNIASKQREAEADLSYDLQKNISAQKVKEQEVQIQVVEKQKQIQVQKSEAERREVELVATVRKPAEAKQYEIQTLATAEQFKLKTTAEGQAEANRLTGFASAEIRQKQGEAEAAANKAQGLAHAEGQEGFGLEHLQPGGHHADADRSDAGDRIRHLGAAGQDREDRDDQLGRRRWWGFAPDSGRDRCGGPDARRAGSPDGHRPGRSGRSVAWLGPEGEAGNQDRVAGRSRRQEGRRTTDRPGGSGRELLTNLPIDWRPPGPCPGGLFDSCRRLPGSRPGDLCASWQGLLKRSRSRNFFTLFDGESTSESGGNPAIHRFGA